MPGIGGDEQSLPLDLQQALELKERGNAAFRDRRFDDALASYDSAAQMDPDNPALHLNAVMALLKLEKYHDAIQRASNVLRMTADGSSKAFFRRAAAYEALGRWSEAAVDYREALALQRQQSGARDAAGLRKAAADEALTRKRITHCEAKLRDAPMRAQAHQPADDPPPCT